VEERRGTGEGEGREEATVARGEPFFILRLIISDCKLSATNNERLCSLFLPLSLSLSLCLFPPAHVFPFLLFLKILRLKTIFFLV